MAEETTQNMDGGRSLEERIMARFDAMDARFNTMEARFDGRFNHLDTHLTALGERVDRRLLETRPIWESMQKQLEELNDKVDRLKEKVDVFATDIYDPRADVRSIGRRVARLEESRSS